MSTLAKRSRADTVSAPLVEVMPLGAGQEVGRSCIILRYLGKTVMLDCGIHPGYSGLASLPFFDEIDLADVDVALITHFHLDHCAAVPYLVGHTQFRGRIFMTHPTKAIVHTLLKDFVKVSKAHSPDGKGLYSDKDLELATERTEVIDFQQTVDVEGIRVTPYRAGHVLGAAMFEVEIAGMRLLYTGDYSRVADRHMPPADLPTHPPDIVVVESTYGVSRHLPRDEREQRFAERVHTAVARGGKVLLPVVALGRAQELLLILEEYWERHPELHGVPIYQASGLARRAMSVYKTYIEMMNDDIRKAFEIANPFQFKHITHLKSLREYDDVGACVVMATPSMLQSGASRSLFDEWCTDTRNLVIIADFAVQGTLARDILAGPAEIVKANGMKAPLRMQVDAISFSAHADFPQTSEFLDALQPPHVILVHGEATEMGRLKKALEQHATALGTPRIVYTPRLGQEVLIEHKAKRIARLTGRMGEKPPVEGQSVQGLLVETGGGDLALMHHEDLPTFTKLHPGRVEQKQVIALRNSWSDVRLALEAALEGVITVQGLGDSHSLRIGDAVTLVVTDDESAVFLSWISSSEADMIADAVVAVALGAAGRPVGLAEVEVARREALANGDADAVERAELGILTGILGAQFGPTRVDLENKLIHLNVDGEEVVVSAFCVERCEEAGLRQRIEKAVQRAAECISLTSGKVL